mmetsp:Transcript_12841/g.30277  ORF Transcript_12841/g.30277 Transcript_12841/m.30277 type:complete len:224 (-) Transcript_12841:604-1275(-)
MVLGSGLCRAPAAAALSPPARGAGAGPGALADQEARRALPPASPRRQVRPRVRRRPGPRPRDAHVPPGRRPRHCARRAAAAHLGRIRAPLGGPPTHGSQQQRRDVVADLLVRPPRGLLGRQHQPRRRHGAHLLGCGARRVHVYWRQRGRVGDVVACGGRLPPLATRHPCAARLAPVRPVRADVLPHALWRRDLLSGAAALLARRLRRKLDRAAWAAVLDRRVC